MVPVCRRYLLCCKIGSFGKIYKKINSWNGNLFFIFERMSEDRLTFLNCEIFIKNNRIELKNYRKFGLDTLLQNNKESVSPKKYLIANIWTQFHNVADTSSNEFYLLEGLKRAEIILLRNEYPKYLVQSEMREFLQNVLNPKDPK